jgi:hypothetical protein
MLYFYHLRAASTLVSAVMLFILHLGTISCTQSQQTQTFTKFTIDSQKVALNLNAMHLAIGLDNMRHAIWRMPINRMPTELCRGISQRISTLTMYAILAQSTSELEKAVKTMEYSFLYQKPEGDFQIVVPPSLATMPLASETDLASGTAFFYRRWALDFFPCRNLHGL